MFLDPSIKTIALLGYFRKRKYGERHIILGMMALSFVSSLKSSTSSQLYTQKKFGWSVTQYTNYEMFWVKFPFNMSIQLTNRNIAECSYRHQGISHCALSLLLPQGSRLHPRHHGPHKRDRGVPGVRLCHQGMAHVLWCGHVSL